MKLRIKNKANWEKSTKKNRHQNDFGTVTEEKSSGQSNANCDDTEACNKRYMAGKIILLSLASNQLIFLLFLSFFCALLSPYNLAECDQKHQSKHTIEMGRDGEHQQ